MNEQLGERMLLVAITIRGMILKHQCVDLTEKIIKKVGLSSTKEAMMCNYPTKDGKGGVGYTYFCPITESFMTWDVWPKLKAAYLIICSCKLFWVVDAVKVIEEANLKVLEVKTEGLTINGLLKQGLHNSR
jgi:hypothetical protein